MTAFSRRVWLYCFLVAGLFTAIARYDLWVNGAQSTLEMFIFWPGWLATVFLGASAHGGELGHGWDYLVVFLIGGAIWGTLLFTLFAVTRFVARRPAA
jgi:hypothetical protein